LTPEEVICDPDWWTMIESAQRSVWNYTIKFTSTKPRAFVAFFKIHFVHLIKRIEYGICSIWFANLMHACHTAASAVWQHCLTHMKKVWQVMVRTRLARDYRSVSFIFLSIP
jgi:hypothetical protein